MKVTIRKNLKFGITTILISLSSLIAFTNPESDSLDMALFLEPDSMKIQMLQEMAEEMFDSDPESAEQHYRTAIALARVNGYRNREANLCYELGIFFWMKGEYELALQCDHNALKIFESLRDSAGIAKANMGLGVTLSEMGRQEHALRHYHTSQTIFEEQNDSISLMHLYLNLGAMYDMVGNPDKALNHYFLSKELAESVGEDLDVADVLHNIANIYSDHDSLELALNYYDKALAIQRKHGEQASIALTLSNAGLTHAELKDFAKAEEKMSESIQISRKIDDKANLCYALNSMAKVLLDSDRAFTAGPYIEEGADIADKNNYSSELQHNKELKSIWLHKTGKHESAFVAYEEYISMRDSLEKENRYGQIDNMMLLFETEKRDREIYNLKAQKERDQLNAARKNLFLIFGGILILLMGLLALIIYRAYKVKRSATELLKDQQERLTIINDKLEKEKSSAVSATRAKADFLSTMTHELRTPLNAVIGVTNLLSAQNTDPGQQENLRTLDFASRNLLGLINDILDFNKLETGNIEFESIEIILEDLLDDIGNSFKTEVAKKNLEFKIECESDVPKRMMGDPMRITQVISNLISNAIKFTSEGMIGVYTSLSKDEKGNEIINFQIKDTGIGIAAPKQNAIFEAFSQAETSTTRKYGGTGLGLAICKKIAILNHGDIILESTAGVGSTFTFSVPLEHVDYDSTPIRTIEHNDIDHVVKLMAGKRVLLVDDNEMNLYVARMILMNHGIDVVDVTSGQAALDKVIESQFDIVLMDLQMPGMDGFEASEKIKDIHSTLPIVALSASNREEVNLDANNHLFINFIRKPFEVEHLLRTLYSAINRAGRMSA